MTEGQNKMTGVKIVCCHNILIPILLKMSPQTLPSSPSHHGGRYTWKPSPWSSKVNCRVRHFWKACFCHWFLILFIRPLFRCWTLHTGSPAGGKNEKFSLGGHSRSKCPTSVSFLVLDHPDILGSVIHMGLGQVNEFWSEAVFSNNIDYLVLNI